VQPGRTGGEMTIDKKGSFFFGIYYNSGWTRQINSTQLIVANVRSHSTERSRLEDIYLLTIKEHDAAVDYSMRLMWMVL